MADQENKFDPEQTQVREDTESTQRISVYEREQINTEWAKTIDDNLEAAAEVGTGTSGERLEVNAGDSPEFRSKLNDVNRRYKFLEKYAEGGFGIIYKAMDRTLDRTVIIKSLRKEYINDQIAVKRFISEAKLNAQLDHPAIVPLYSLDSDPSNGLHLAMKFIDGLTLKDFLTRLKVKYNLNKITQPMERKSLRHRLEYFIKICQAVEYSHSRDVIHCDLKPENIMIGSYGEVYIMDWGTAAAPGIAPTGSVEGTPAYLSPETLTNGAVDRLGDIFSLGFILYEMVTLKRAVDGANVNEITQNIKDGKFEPVEHYESRLKIQPGLKAIIYKTMSHNPSQRYQSISDLADDVRRFMFHEEVSARPDTLLQKAARKMYHNRIKSFGILALFIIMLVALTAFSFYRQAAAGEQASFQIMRYIRLQSSTEHQANNIDKYFLHTQNLLRAFSTSLVFVLENSLKEEYAGKIYSLEDFKNKVSQPADFKFSKAYSGPVSLQFPVYNSMKKVSPKDLDNSVRKFYMLRDFARNILLQSEPGTILNAKNRKALTSMMLNEGMPAKRLFAVLKTGVLISYPGSSNLDIWNSPQNWNWYRQAREKRRIIWGHSYIDPSGQMMLPCASPLINVEGRILGVCGIDMSFNYIIQRLMYNISFQEGIEKYIVNEKNQVVVSSITNNDPTRTGATPKHQSLRPFLYEDVLKKLRASGERQLDTVIDDVRYIFSYAPITSLNWNFVQVVKFDTLMSVDPAHVDAQERKTMAKYQEYRTTALKTYLHQQPKTEPDNDEESEEDAQTGADTPAK